MASMTASAGDQLADSATCLKRNDDHRYETLDGWNSESLHRLGIPFSG